MATASRDAASPHPAIEDVPVLISGCGPVGMIMSVLLSRQGIRNLVVEKRDRVSTLPRARGITIRSVEILSQLGMGEAIDEMSLPPAWTRYFVYTETLAGEIIGEMPTQSMAPGAHAAITPCDYKVAAQDRIDPMLYAAATSYPEAEIRFRTELVGYEESDEAIVATVRPAGGGEGRIRARYLVAADGGKSLLRRLAGIGEVGRTNLRSFVNNHVIADLGRFTENREGALIWTMAPGVEGLFQSLDGGSKWAVQVQFDPAKDSADAWTQERALTSIRAMIGDPAAEEVEFEVLKSYTYTLSAMIAERLRSGRLLLIGDAAHQVPPYGGFGLNTGLQTAHNLAWKLGAVLRGEASDALLDTFDAERREVAARVCDFGRINAGYVEQLMAAMQSAATAEERHAIVARSVHYGNWLGLDLGVHYESDGAFVADDVPAPALADPIVDFVPHAKPGWRAPHIWVERDGERLSSVMLFERDFVLLAAADGSGWIEGAGAIGDGPAILAYRVAADGDLIPEGDFAELYGIGPTGAVLVRPDGHVAFRAGECPADPAATLRAALDRVLRRA